MTLGLHPDEVQRRAAIKAWSQGDCVLGTLPALWGFHPGWPITAVSRDGAEGLQDPQEMEIAGDDVEGLIVISQTCDIVREIDTRPFVQVAPLVRVKPDQLNGIRLRMVVRLAYLPGLAGECLVADLERIFTVEKAFLAMWERRCVLATQVERASFADTLSRFFRRPALPNDFANGIKRFLDWVRKQHDRKPSPGGTGVIPFHPGPCLQALEMVLVRAHPSWNDPSYDVRFLLVYGDAGDSIPASDWEAFKEACNDQLELPDNITAECEVIHLDGLQARTYLESEFLDLEHLSDASRE